ncbi:penicillin-binding transpeptidase domain-containing protein [Nanchangia anserum]|uniref:penicillin-binding transpeptidase domain-containing protein n=1 Tax=Nanchangia anserum TaxID=2692125 RepID=UPI003B847CFC
MGTAIALDVKTGAVLALADSGQMSPDEVKEGKAKTTGSRAVQYTYEPGSTGKLVTFAAGLEHEAFTPLTRVSTPYEITMRDNQTFRDAHDHPTLQLTAAGVLAESSNTGTVQLGDR